MYVCRRAWFRAWISWWVAGTTTTAGSPAAGAGAGDSGDAAAGAGAATASDVGSLGAAMAQRVVYDKHESLAYGVDWISHPKNLTCAQPLVASASFYDHCLHLWRPKARLF